MEKKTNKHFHSNFSIVVVSKRLCAQTCINIKQIRNITEWSIKITYTLKKKSKYSWECLVNPIFPLLSGNGICLHSGWPYEKNVESS